MAVREVLDKEGVIIYWNSLTSLLSLTSLSPGKRTYLYVLFPQNLPNRGL